MRSLMRLMMCHLFLGMKKWKVPLTLLNQSPRVINCNKCYAQKYFNSLFPNVKMPRSNGNGKYRAARKSYLVSQRKARRQTRFMDSRRSGALAVVNRRTGGYEDLENKFVDYNVAGDAFTTTWAGGEMEDGTALCLSSVGQGDTESTRDGRVYHINSVHIKGFINVDVNEGVTAPGADALARLALVWDTQTNSAQLNAEDVFKTIGAGEDVNSFRNLQYSKRFIVLKDKLMRLPTSQANMNEGAQNLFANARVRIPFAINKKFRKPIKVRCNGVGATVAAITDNSLHLIGTSTLTSTDLTYQSRVRFQG